MILVEASDTGGPSSITVEINNYLFFNSHTVNFVWETDEGVTGSIILLIFILLGCFNCWWVRVEAEHLIWR